MTIRVPFFILVGLVLAGGPVCAQDEGEVTVSAVARPSEVGTEEPIRVEVEVTGVSLSDIETPDPPETANLVLEHAAPAPKRELSFDSGSLTRTITFSWTYRPLRVGVGRVQPVSIQVQGHRYTTDEIRVRVVPQSQRPQRTPGRSVSPERRGASVQASRVGLRPRDLFIRATPAADTVFQNEQFTVEYRLFFRPGVRLRQSRMADAWDAPGFWREELDVASRPTPQATRAYGEQYQSIVLKRVALFPTRVGTLYVDPLRIETEARSDGHDEASDAPGSPNVYEPVTLSSERVQVISKGLPPDPPPTFQGAVGQFAMDTEVVPESVKVGNAVELRAHIQGSGNLATVAPPDVDVPDGFVGYDPKVEVDLDRSQEQVRGRKTFIYTLIPQSNGRFTLPPIAFSYFNGDTESYHTVRSEPTSLPVTGDVPPEAVSQTGRGLPIGDIAGPKTEEVQWLAADRPPLYRQPWAYAVVLASVVIAASGAAYRRWAAGGSVVATANKDGLEAAQQHLHRAHRYLREGDVEAFYGTVERAVLSFLSIRLGLSKTPAGLTRGDLDEPLDRDGVSPSDRDALRELLNACDEAQFAPSAPTHDSMEATLNHAQQLVIRLDETLPDRTSNAE